MLSTQNMGCVEIKPSDLTAMLDGEEMLSIFAF